VKNSKKININIRSEFKEKEEKIKTSNFLNKDI